MVTPGIELGGVAEIAEEFGVNRNNVSMWDARRETSGFPAPVLLLAMGPLYDMAAVRAWHAAWRAKRSGVAQAGTG